MGIIRKFIRTTFHVLAVATDWMLIVLGIVLILVSFKSIDVQIARYVVVGAGVFFAAIGFWYRFRRLQTKASE